MQPSDAEQVLQMRLAGCLPPQSTYLQWHERHAAAVSRGDGLHPNIHYSTYKGAIAFSHNLIICCHKNWSAHESRHTFSARPDPTKGTINNERSSKRRSAQDLLYVSITQKLRSAHATRVCVAFRMDLLREFSLSRPTKAQ